MIPHGSLLDQTPSQSSRVPTRLEIRSLREVISSCDKLTLGEQVSLSASVDSMSGLDSSRTSTSWVGSFHEKILSKTPGKTYSAGTPTHRQLNFNTPAGKKPDRPSPTVSSVYSDRWCLDSMTPGMRYTPPNMALRGMRSNAGPREAIAAYRMDVSARRENERGNSLCILPTPLLRYQPSPEVSPVFVPSKPSPTISMVLGSPTPGGPVQKKPRGRDFPTIPPRRRSSEIFGKKN